MGFKGGGLILSWLNCRWTKRNTVHFFRQFSIVKTIACATILCSISLLSCSASESVKVEGWEDVTNKRPLNEANYFLATEDARVSLKRVSEDLGDDLLVKFEYYYDYDSKQEPPVFIIRCGDTSDGQNLNEEESRKWRTFSKQFDCKDRSPGVNLLVIDVTRLKSGFFAWRSLSVEKSRNGENSTINEQNNSGENSLTQKRTEPYICKPDSCDYSNFEIKQFTRVPKIPENTPKNLQYYLNDKKDRPLSITFQPDDNEICGSLDVCYEFKLFMENDQELNISLLEPHSNALDRKWMSEIIKPTDLTVDGWKPFRRCISDYMPSYELIPDNTIRIEIKPVKDGKLVGLLIAPESFRVSHQYPVNEFAPDIRHMKDAEEFNNSWILDRNGPKELTIEFEDASSRSNQVEGMNKVLAVKEIDLDQESFTITSRWMRIRFIELIKGPIMFAYKAELPDWIDTVELQYQRLNNSWHSKSFSINLNGDRILDKALEMKGMDGETFRVRVRHKRHRASFSKEGPSSYNEVLRISSLSFADGCLGNNGHSKCGIGGKCRPTAPADFECVCEVGYSPPLCDRFNPCDAKYGHPKWTGHQICQELGSVCKEKLGKIDCQKPGSETMSPGNSDVPNIEKTSPANSDVPNIEKTSPANSDVPNIETTSPANSDVPNNANSNNGSNLVERLREQISNKQCTIITLSVLLCSSLIFHVVLVGSLIIRMRKSKLRLEQARNEIQGLSRNISSGISTIGGGVLGGTRATGLLAANVPPPRRDKLNEASYNNTAFDIE